MSTLDERISIKDWGENITLRDSESRRPDLSRVLWEFEKSVVQPSAPRLSKAAISFENMDNESLIIYWEPQTNVHIDWKNTYVEIPSSWMVTISSVREFIWHALLIQKGSMIWISLMDEAGYKSWTSYLTFY